MDRSKMLIQQLALAASRGEDNSVLLALVEEIRNELSRPVHSGPVAESVSVILPHGFSSRETPAPGTSPTENATRRPGLTVPRPPVVVAVEEEPQAESSSSATILHAPDPEVSEWVAPAAGDTVLDSPEAAISPQLVNTQAAEAEISPWMPPLTTGMPAADGPAAEEEVVPALMHSYNVSAEYPPAEPITLELPLTPEMIAEAVALEMEAARPVVTAAEETALSPEPYHTEAPPPDLNGKMAQRNKMLNEVFARPEPDLAAVLATPRIADLRKAISINEKYQFINTLFRGDEDMFERSIKTLNNFQVMQEANYWMQRELLIKLGWNDEDELVQRFFELVSRRFS